MKRINLILRKCKSLRQLGRSSSYSSLRSMSTTEEPTLEDLAAAGNSGCSHDEVVVLVGRSRRPYLISSKHLNHPLLAAVIDRSKHCTAAAGSGDDDEISVKCEVVLFDHLLWMLENADDLDLVADDGAALEELAELYAC